MAPTANASPPFAFNAARMKRFWTLENDFLASFSQTESDMSARRNRLLLSAVLFGGLLNEAGWRDWIAAIMGKLRGLSAGQRLDQAQTRSVHIRKTGQLWFADPLTQNLLARPVGSADLSLATVPTDDSDYARLIRLTEDALIKEVEDWVLPAAKVKMTLLWPPLIVEHSAGASHVKSLTQPVWTRLEQPRKLARLPAPITELETIRVEREPRVAKAERNFYFSDKGFSFIFDAILKAIQTYATSDDPTLDLEQEALKDELEASLEWHLVYSPTGCDPDSPHQNNLGWWIYQWFLAFCPTTSEKLKIKPKRARTLNDHVVTLGLRVDWSDVWHVPLKDIDAKAITAKLHAVVRSKPDGFHLARRLYSYLGFGELSRPAGASVSRRATGIKSQILSQSEYEAVLAQLSDRTGGRGAHWLAAMLMFRCGLRAREIVAMEVDHITVVGKVIELKIDATPYVALKNKTSERTLPLHALLTSDELAELLRWRALRIRDCAQKRRHARLLFATVYDPSDYPYLFDPIEAAIRTAHGQPAPTKDERASAAYIFSRCSVLRHSFVSYAVATMLLPRDDGGFQLPAGITPDLVSLARRERLERALLAEGHLGLSSLEAVRQLTGHAHFHRTLRTYTHLLDLVAGAYGWRRSSEPSLPAEVVCALSPDQLKVETLSHYARKESGEEAAAFKSAVEALKRGDEARPVLVARERRPRGQRFPDWMPKGNAFLSQLRNARVDPGCAADDELPEWRRGEVGDWRTLDQIVQMASRGVPARLVADEVGVRLAVVERLVQRYHQLLCLRRRTTGSKQGKYRHRLLLEDSNAFTDAFDTEHGCWYGPLEPIPVLHQDRVDLIWTKLRARRDAPDQLSKMQDFLCRHQDGQLLSKGEKPLAEIAQAFQGLLTDGSTWLSDVEIKRLRKKSDSSWTDRYLLYFKGRFERPEGWQRRAERWEANRVLLHLFLLAESSAPGALPDALVTTPVVTGQTKVAEKIAADKERKLKQAEYDRRQKEAADQAKADAEIQANQAVWARSKERMSKHAMGEKTFITETRSSKKSSRKK